MPATARSVSASAASPTPPVPEPPATALPLPTPLPPERPIYIVDPIYDPNAHAWGVLSRILVVDPDKQEVARTLTMRFSPEIALSADGRRLYVADSYRTRVIRGEYRDVVSMYDALTGELLVDDMPIQRRLLYKGFPNRDPFLFLSDDGRQLYVMKYGEPDVRELRLAVLDPETLQTLHEGVLPPCGTRLQARSDRWVCANTTFPVEVPDGPGVSVSLSIDVVDPQRGVILETLFTVEDLRNGIVDLVPSGDGNRLYLIDNDAVVTVIDIQDRTATTAGQLEVNAGWHIVGEDIVLSPDDKRLYAGFDTGDDGSQYFTDAIKVYDTTTWQSIATIELSDMMARFALSAEGDQLYVVSPFMRSLAIFDTAMYREVAVLSDLGETPAAVVVPPARR